MATIEKSFDAGLHTEQLSGRTQEIFFSAVEEENFVYPYNAFEVDSSKKKNFIYNLCVINGDKPNVWSTK